MNSRRIFFKQLLTGIGAFAILPPATTYERIWRAERKVITCAEFTQLLLDQTPIYDALILQRVIPSDMWICHAKLANHGNPP